MTAWRMGRLSRCLEEGSWMSESQGGWFSLEAWSAGGEAGVGG